LTNSERFIAALNVATGPICDDCASVKASVFPRQQVNQIARSLYSSGRIGRGEIGQCCYCGLLKKVSWTRSTEFSLTSTDKTETAPDAGESVALIGAKQNTRPWYWEGNVQSVLCEQLKREGWMITSFANTETKESGIDVVANRSGRVLMVEVKGFPSTTYDHGEKRGLPKPTQPTSQARQWYSHALLSVMKMLEKHPDAKIALCFPEFPTYQKLINSTRSPLIKLGIGAFFVSSTGKVTEHLLTSA
jgi:Holliday junction resolvase-like predicted endonuclease